MKKLFTLLFISCIGLLSYAQTDFGTEYLNEDFSSEQMPPAGWTIDNEDGNWGISSSAKSGGSAPEGQLHYVQGDFATYLISPEIDLTGVTELSLSFKHFLDDYSGSGYTIGFASRSNGGAWNDIWSVAPTGNMGPETITVPVETADLGAADFQLAIYLDGNHYNYDDWFFDDIVLFTPFDTDGAVTNITVPSMLVAGPQDVTGVFTNGGNNEITSMDINWKIDEGTVYTTSYTGISIAFGETMDFTCDDQLDLTAGAYELSVWCSNINGNGDDDDPSNDMTTKSISIATDETQRLVLCEEFTSSTCGPCANFNANTLPAFEAENEGKYAMIKYQMSWPGSGDIYYTEEGGVRRNYYGISGVPNFVCEAENWGTSVNQDQFDEFYAKPSFFEVTGNHSIDGDNISIDITVNPFVTVENITLHCVIIENETTENVGSNGETSFEYVMMKMMPDGHGAQVDFVAGTPYTVNYTHDMSTTNVEEMDDLDVIIFLQNDANSEVLQSAYSEEGVAAPSVAANIANNAEDVLVDENIVFTFSQPIRNLDDSEITNANVAEHITLKLENASGADVPFTATINDAKTVITVDPAENLEYLTQYYTAIDATVENSSDMPINPLSLTFTTILDEGIDAVQNINNISVYPNPTTNIANIAFNLTQSSDISIKVYDLAGKEVKVIQNNTMEAGDHIITVSDLNSGAYLIRIATDNNVITKRVSVL
jgi:hypothetical protein